MNFFQTVRETLNEAADPWHTHSALHAAHHLSNTAHGLTHGSMLRAKPSREAHVAAADAHKAAFKAHTALDKKSDIEHHHHTAHSMHAALHKSMHNMHMLQADPKSKGDWEAL